MELGHSQGTVTVARSSRFSATTGLTVNSHAPPTADLFAHANIHVRQRVSVFSHHLFSFQVHMDMKGSFWTSRGKWMFGRCISQFSGSSPVRIQGRAYGHVFAKVVMVIMWVFWLEIHRRCYLSKTIWTTDRKNCFRVNSKIVMRALLVWEGDLSSAKRCLFRWSFKSDIPRR